MKSTVRALALLVFRGPLAALIRAADAQPAERIQPPTPTFEEAIGTVNPWEEWDPKDAQE